MRQKVFIRGEPYPRGNREVGSEYERVFSAGAVWLRPTGPSSACRCASTRPARPAGFALFGAPYVTPYDRGGGPAVRRGRRAGRAGLVGVGARPRCGPPRRCTSRSSTTTTSTSAARSSSRARLSPSSTAATSRAPSDDPAAASAAITAVSRAVASARRRTAGHRRRPRRAVLRRARTRRPSPVHVLQIDAHLDFRDEVGGVRDGYSSPMRRLRDLVSVETIVQVGLRDIGSALPRRCRRRPGRGQRPGARRGGARGAASTASPRCSPRARRLYVTVDVDGLDPSCAPGVLWPAPGGLQFWQVARLLRTLATTVPAGRHGRVRARAGARPAGPHGPGRRAPADDRRRRNAAAIDHRTAKPLAAVIRRWPH